VITIALVVSLVVGGGAARQATDQVEAARVRKVAEGIIAADNARDLSRVLSLYGDDAVLLPPGEDPVRGKAAIKPRYENLFSHFNPEIVGDIEELRVNGDWASVMGRNRGRMTPRDGGDARLLNDVYLMVLKRTGDRAWRISRLMWHPAGGQRPPATTERELQQIEQQLAATWKAGDCDAWGAMLAPEWSVTHMTGAVMTRAEALEMCRTSRPPIESLTIDQVSVRPFEDSAVVTGRTSLVTGGASPETFRLRFTDFFVRRGGRWLVVASHATRLQS
jgi:uncharacterized protein (TIGR02246 family)